MTAKTRIQAIDIESINPKNVEQHLRDMALVTLTNVSDWNFRFVSAEDETNRYRRDLICFTHPTAKAHSVPVSYFAKPVSPVEIVLKSLISNADCYEEHDEADEGPKPDVQITFQGSVALFAPITRRARCWIKRHVADPQFFGCALVCEWRYAKSLAAGMRKSGLQLA